MEKHITTQKPENTGIIRDEQGKFVKGVSGNPLGKPVGATSITSAIRKFLEDNPDKFEELFMDYLNDKRHRELLWKMIDGVPRNEGSVDIANVEKLVIVVKE